MTDRVVRGTHAKGHASLAEQIMRTWPPVTASAKPDYATVDLEQSRCLDAVEVPLPGQRRGAVAVVANEAGKRAALPLYAQQPSGAWQVGAAGDGLSEALLVWLGQLPTTQQEPAAGFALRRFAPVGPDIGERGIAADQTNMSIVVGSTAIIKWRTAFAADGIRGLTLREHLREHAYPGIPGLLGALIWRGPDGRTSVLADIDAHLDEARDGWDHFSDLLRAGDSAAADFPAALGALVAGLHVALRASSTVLPTPLDRAGPGLLAGWHDDALQRLDRALAIDAPDEPVVRTREAHMRADLERLRGPAQTLIQPIHGDLHLGQLVAWSGGLAIIDFDGPPGGAPTDGLTLEPTARDVAQMLCSLDHLGAVMCHRESAWSDSRAASWAQSAKDDFLASYRAVATTAGVPDALDERLLRPFVVDQLCRELIYADDVLPRWRYAPLTALRWLYPKTDA